MPLIKLAKINQGSAWAIWKVEESADELRQHLAPPMNSWAEWKNVRHPQKQLEWLAARVALRSIFDRMDEPMPPVHKDERGKPWLHKSTYHISLANSFPYGVAILHRYAPVGIDVEQPGDKLLRVQHKYLNCDEMLAVADRSQHACWYWCVKEALYKLYGRKQLSLKDHIAVHSLRFSENVRAQASISIGSERWTYWLEGTIIDGFFVIYSVV